MLKEAIKNVDIDASIITNLTNYLESNKEQVQKEPSKYITFSSKYAFCIYLDEGTIGIFYVKDLYCNLCVFGARKRITSKFEITDKYDLKKVEVTINKFLEGIKL